jgi:hypothetical protein
MEAADSGKKQIDDSYSLARGLTPGLQTNAIACAGNQKKRGCAGDVSIGCGNRATPPDFA